MYTVILLLTIQAGNSVAQTTKVLYNDMNIVGARSYFNFHIGL